MEPAGGNSSPKAARASDDAAAARPSKRVRFGGTGVLVYNADSAPAAVSHAAGESRLQQLSAPQHHGSTLHTTSLNRQLMGHTTPCVHPV